MKELGKGSVISHQKYGQGVIARVSLTHYEVYFERAGKMEISKSNTDFEVMEEEEATQGAISISELERLMDHLLDRYGLLPSELPIGERWKGGNMILQPFNPELKPKEIPVEVFFHKIVMLRDNIRVMEQKINSHSGLSDEDKVQLQQYITKMYGSLTTFNVLFAEKDHYFKGAGKG